MDDRTSLIVDLHAGRAERTAWSGARRALGTAARLGRDRVSGVILVTGATGDVGSRKLTGHAPRTFEDFVREHRETFTAAA